MLKTRYYVLIIFSVLLGFSSLSAQDNGAETGGFGRLQGTITDASSGNTLIGANILLEGTSLGAATDADGTYTVNRIPSGTYTVRISSIGYTMVDTTLAIPRGETVELNVSLTPQAVEGEEVVVSAQAEGQRQAVNQQLSSNTIKNVVAKEKIRELPDESAAAAVSRLPGVSLQEGDKVVVRGIQAKMNTVMVNGVELPSTDMEDRSTNLGFISSNMLSGIEVTKAVTPDMNANSIGGVVNLRLQEAPEGLHYDVMTQGGYNTQDNTKDNYKVWASISNRFFDNKLGVFIQGNASRENAGNDVSQATYQLIQQGEVAPYGEGTYGMENFLYGDQVNITDQSGASLILDYKVPNGKLVMQNTYAATNNDLTTHRDLLQFTDIDRRFEIRRDIHDKKLFINALQGQNDFGFMKIDYGISHAYSEKQTDLRYGEDYGFGFVNNSDTPFQGDFDREARLQMTPQDVYDLTLNDEYVQNASFWQVGATREQNFTEKVSAGNLNLTFPITLSETISGKFKLGGSLKITDRENDVQRTTSRITENPTKTNSLAQEWMTAHNMDYTKPPQFADFKDYDYGDDRGDLFLGGDYLMNDVLNTDLFDKYIRLASPAWGLHKADSNGDDFSGTETLGAGYFMFDYNIGAKLELLGGVRYENLHSEYDANMILLQQEQDGTSRIPNEEYDTPEVQSVADSLTTADRTVDHWFPNIQMRFKATDWLDFRLAYTKTVSRPDYTAIVPRIYYDNPNAGSAGNPNLKPSISDNYDAYASIYNNKIGLFTAGVFYKKIDDIFYQDTRFYETLDESIIYPNPSEIDRINYQEPASKANITTYFNNPNPAHLRGFELEWQTHFWYLPKPFSYMVLNANYTRTFSEMDYAQTIYKDTTIYDPRPRIIVRQIDTVRTARLIYQGDHVINIALGADYKGFSGRISFRMQGDVITSVGTRPEEDAFTGNIYNWDFTIRQKLPVEGLSLFLNGINIFHTPNKDYQKFKRSIDGEVQNNLRRTTYVPRRFQIGIRYSY